MFHADPVTYAVPAAVMVGAIILHRIEKQARLR